VKRIMKGHLLAFTLPLLLSGCLSQETKDNVQAFGEQSKTLTTIMQGTIQEIQTEKNEYLVLQSVLHPSADYNGLIRVSGINTTLTPDKIEAYNQALAFLKDYFDALSKIASDDNLDTIQKNSQDLYASLNSINDSLSKLDSSYQSTDLNLGPFATIVNEGVKLGYEHKRTEYIQQITNQASSILRKLLPILKHSFSPCQGIESSKPFNPHLDTINQCGPWSGLYFQVLSPQISEYFQRSNNLSGSNAYDFEKAMTFSKRAQTDLLKLITLNEEMKKIQTSIDSLQSAHQALVDSINQDSHINRTNAVDKLNHLYGAVSDAIGFYNSLKKEDN